MRASLVVSCLLSLPGCYLSHQRHPTDAAVVDVRPIDAPRADAPDAPPPTRCVHRTFGERQITSFVDHGARTPELARTSSGLSTVFLESDGDIPHPVVSLVHATDALDGVTTPLLVGEESHSWAEVLVLEDETLAIGWLSDPGLVNRTALRRIDAFGRPFGDRIDVDFEGSSCLDLARVGPLVAVAYRGMVEDASVVFLTFLDAIGGGRRSERFLVGPDDPSPQLVGLDDTHVLAVIPGPGTLGFRTYTTDGPLAAELVYPIARSVGRTVAARAPDGTLLVATQVGEMRERGLLVHVFDAGLNLIASPIEIVPERFGVIGTHVAATGAGFVLSWGETLGDFGDGRFVVAHLGLDGLPSEARRVVFSGQLGSFAGPSVTATVDRTWLATSRPPGGAGHAQLFLAGYACEDVDPCGPSDATAPGGCSETILFGHRWDGAACVPLEGCTACEGADCDALASTAAECEIDHAICTR